MNNSINAIPSHFKLWYKDAVESYKNLFSNNSQVISNSKSQDSCKKLQKKKK